jgi:hypothetical protein
MNYHTISVGGDNEWNYIPTHGIQAGLVIDLRLYKKLYIQPAVMLSSRGGRTKSTIDETVDNFPLHAVMTRKVSAYYIEIPLAIQYRFPISDNSRISIDIAPYLAFGIAGDTEIHWEGRYRGESDTEDVILDTFYKEEDSFPRGEIDNSGTLGMKRVDVGFRFGGGFHIHQFYLGVNYSLGLVNAADKRSSLNSGNVSLKNSNFGILAGYNF